MASLSWTINIVHPPPREVGLNTTHKSSDSSKRNSKGNNNDSKAKTIKGTRKHSKEKGTSKQDFKKGISQTEIKGVFRLHKSSIDVSTYITGASTQAAGSLDLSSVTALHLQLKRRAVYQTWAHQSSKSQNHLLIINLSLAPPASRALTAFLG